MLGTAVPKATINKDCKLLTGEDEVGLPAQPLQRRHVNAVTESKPMDL
jgi:hypothetical protein